MHGRVTAAEPCIIADEIAVHILLLLLSLWYIFHYNNHRWAVKRLENKLINDSHSQSIKYPRIYSHKHVLRYRHNTKASVRLKTLTGGKRRFSEKYVIFIMIFYCKYNL